jgi:hypothetical protein
MTLHLKLLCKVSLFRSYAYVSNNLLYGVVRRVKDRIRNLHHLCTSIITVGTGVISSAKLYDVREFRHNTNNYSKPFR